MATLFSLDVEPSGILVAANKVVGATVNGTEENDLILEIEAGQEQQARFLDAAESYYLDIFRNSTNHIPISRRKVETPASPDIIAEEMIISPSGSSGLADLVKKGQESFLFSPFYWRLGDSVFLTNKMYSLSNIPMDVDIMATREMKELYFLENKDNEMLHDCRTAFISSPYSSIDKDRVINYSDAKALYLKSADIVDMVDHTIMSPNISITADTIISTEGSVVGNLLASTVHADSGTVTVSDFSQEFLSQSNQTILDSSVIPNSIPTNVPTLYSSSVQMTETKAPLNDWNPALLKKSDSKNSTFLSSFVDSVLSGDSIPDESTQDFGSAVSKGELDAILLSLKDRILHMDICNDS